MGVFLGVAKIHFFSGVLEIPDFFCEDAWTDLRMKKNESIPQGGDAGSVEIAIIVLQMYCSKFQLSTIL